MCEFFMSNYSNSPEYIWGTGIRSGFIFCIIVRRDPCLICPENNCSVEGGNYSDHYISLRERPKELPQQYWEDLKSSKHRPNSNNRFDNYFQPIRKSGRSVSIKTALMTAKEISTK